MYYKKGLSVASNEKDMKELRRNLFAFCVLPFLANAEAPAVKQPQSADYWDVSTQVQGHHEKIARLQELQQAAMMGGLERARQLINATPAMLNVIYNKDYGLQTHRDGTLFSYLVNKSGAELLKTEGRIKALNVLADLGMKLNDEHWRNFELEPTNLQLAVKVNENDWLGYSYESLYELIGSFDQGDSMSVKALWDSFENFIRKSDLNSLQAMENQPESLVSIFHERRLELFSHLSKEYGFSRLICHECFKRIARVLFENTPERLIDIIGESMSPWSIDHITELLGVEALLLTPNRNGDNLLHSVVRGMGLDNRAWLALKSMRCYYLSTWFSQDCADVNKFFKKALAEKNHQQQTPLFLAFATNNFEYAREMEGLLGRRYPPDEKDAEGKTVLHHLALAGHMQAIKDLVIQGHDLFVLDSSHESLLHKAVLSENAELVEYLLEQGLDPNQSNRSGLTPLKLGIQNKGFTELLLALADITGHALFAGLDRQDLEEVLQTPGMAHRYLAEISTGLPEQKKLLGELGLWLLDRHHFEAGWILLRGNPCALYLLREHEWPVMSAICQGELAGGEDIGSGTAIAIPDYFKPWEIHEDDPFGFSPLHLAAMLIGTQKQDEVYHYLVDFGVGGFPTDKQSKTVVHHLLEKKQSRALFRLLIQSKDSSDLLKTYPELMKNAIINGDQESTAVLQLFWFSVYNMGVIYPPTHNLFVDSFFARMTITQTAQREDRFEWVRQYSGNKRISPLDRILTDTIYYSYYELVSAANESPFLASEEVLPFGTMSSLLIDGANPNGWLPFKSPGGRLSFIELPPTKIEEASSFFALSILFGIDIKEILVLSHILYEGGALKNSFKGGSSQIELSPVYNGLKNYRDALIGRDKTRFTASTEGLRIQAAKVLQDLGLEGEFSHIHPICNCLSLKPLGSCLSTGEHCDSYGQLATGQDFTPWCQQKAEMPGKLFGRDLRAICDDYGYSVF
ncbi:MAG: ankyrin repeat domain-containing protein [Endozoicomonas sp.]